MVPTPKEISRALEVALGPGVWVAREGRPVAPYDWAKDPRTVRLQARCDSAELWEDDPGARWESDPRTAMLKQALKHSEELARTMMRGTEVMGEALLRPVYVRLPDGKWYGANEGKVVTPQEVLEAHGKATGAPRAHCGGKSEAWGDGTCPIFGKHREGQAQDCLGERLARRGVPLVYTPDYCDCTCHAASCPDDTKSADESSPP